MTTTGHRPGWWTSLTARAVAVTAAVAVVAVLTTGLVAGQMLRSVAQSQAREALARQADALATSTPQTLIVLAAGRRVLGSDGTRLVLISPAGDVRGSAAGTVPNDLVQRLAGGETLSTSAEIDGALVLVEGRPLATGGAAMLTRPIVEVDRVAERLRRRVLLALAAGLGVAALAGVVLARRITNPLERTAAAARRLAAGERGIPVAAGGGREVTDVATALAALDGALVRSEARQREFLLSVSHDIRTPLTAIRGYAEALADGVIPAEESAVVGRTLLAEAGRLDHFVADLLELARLEADDFRIELAPVDVSATVVDVVRAWSGQAGQARVDLHAVGADSPLVVTTDAMRLRQVLDGLVENALRASPEGGVVRITVQDESLAAVITVDDDGPGLDPADLEVAFERDTLRGRHLGDRAVGTGLGLSIVERLVRRLGGTVTASGGPSRGTAFSVRLPRDPVDSLP